MAAFAVLGGLLMVSLGAMGPIWPGVLGWPFLGCGGMGGLVDCVQSRGFGVRVSSSAVYTAGKLQ